MTTEDMGKLNFPLATMKMLESTTAMLRTVLQNQVVIMKALNIGDPKVVEADVNRLLQENLAIIESDLKQQVPEGNYIIYPKN